MMGEQDPLEGAIEAQDQREREAGARCGVSYDVHGCDWPGAVADEVIELRGKVSAIMAALAGREVPEWAADLPEVREARKARADVRYLRVAIGLKDESERIAAAECCISYVGDRFPEVASRTVIELRGALEARTRGDNEALERERASLRARLDAIQASMREAGARCAIRFDALNTWPTWPELVALEVINLRAKVARLEAKESAHD